MKVIDGNALANELHASIQDELQILRMSAVRPGLAAAEDRGADRPWLRGSVRTRPGDTGLGYEPDQGGFGERR
jgi:hypothetical protein